MKIGLLVLCDQLGGSGKDDILINERIEKELIINLNLIEKEIEQKHICRIILRCFYNLMWKRGMKF